MFQETLVAFLLRDFAVSSAILPAAGSPGAGE